MGTRRRRGPFEDHGVAALYSPADLPVGTRRRCRPSEDDSGLAKRLEQMAKERERRERAAAAADEEFSAEFLTAARKVRSSVQSSPVPARAFVLLFGVLFVSLAWHATLVFGTLVGKLSGIGISGLRLELCSNGIQHGITLVGYRCYPSNSPSLRIGSLGLCLSAAA